MHLPMKARALISAATLLALVAFEAPARETSTGSVPARPADAHPAPAEDPIFVFHTDGFWLNLHHFLYVLGRAEAGMRDAGRRAVAGAPDDQERGLADLPEAEQDAWRRAVSIYAEGPSRLDAVFDEEHVDAVKELIDADVEKSGSLDEVEIEASWLAALRQAAPVYREVWWPEHREANRAWVEATVPLVEEHGPAVLELLKRAEALPWPVHGYPVQIAAYSNWAGAYSTSDRLLVIASLDEELRGTSVGLEIVFHESMHQWDDARSAMLVTAAKAGQVRFPGGLSHAMLFFTVGEAMRTVIPEHVPYAERYGIWERRSGIFLPMLEEAWRPYLHGVVPRDRALSELMRHFR